MNTWDSVKVKELRTRLGLTREDFAALVKIGRRSVSANTVYRWETGQHVPAPHHQDALEHLEARNPIQED